MFETGDIISSRTICLEIKGEIFAWEVQYISGWGYNI